MESLGTVVIFATEIRVRVQLRALQCGLTNIWRSQLSRDWLEGSDCMVLPDLSQPSKNKVT